MGLDIFFYTTKCSQEKNGFEWDKVYRADKTRQKRAFKSLYDKVLKNLKEVAENEPSKYDDAAISAVKQLAEKTNYPDFDLDKLGCQHDYNTHQNIFESVSLDVFEKEEKNVVKKICHYHDAYFRKVNFLYDYFSDALVNEIAWVTVNDLEDIVDRCQKIMDNHSLAPKLLPTRDGFFFGETDYNEYYFYDIEDVFKTLPPLIEKMKKEKLNCYVEMNW